MLDNGFLIQEDESILLNVLEYILRAVSEAGLRSLWNRENEEIRLIVPLENDDVRERLEKAMEKTALEMGKGLFQKFSEWKYKKVDFPRIPAGSTMMCVDQNSNVIFLQ
jgi:hypothetical protein